ncbi:MAG: glycosyltransferase family A protein [Hyphomonas sp.]|uniref:glycosyltransferase family 2 protein n=1 Tax=Hyphomonas sp. TaxID=87 RepID=UPI0035272246
MTRIGTNVCAIVPERHESVFFNGVAGAPSLIVAVPTYRDDPSRLIDALSLCSADEPFGLVVYDDGTGNPVQTSNSEAALREFPQPGFLITAAVNLGRAQARNRLISSTQSEWLLFMDADMLPDSADFISVYLEAARKQAGPALLAGGSSLKNSNISPATRLQAAQAAHSECLPADQRNLAPGQYVFSSNILVHRDILNDVPFDPGYEGWGWEDTDWGISIAKNYPVVHIDNTASHLGLLPESLILSKYGTSGGNFARLAARHPDEVHKMRIYRVAQGLNRFGDVGVSGVRTLSRGLAQSRFMPMSTRLFALKLFRAASYSPYLRSGA